VIALDDFRSCGSMVDQIDRILGEPALLQEVAASSFLHPNGFVRLIVGGDGRAFGERVRLHLWPSDVSAQRTDIHNHCWRFHSTVLAGQVMVDAWDPESILIGGGAPTHVLYEVGSLQAPRVGVLGPVALRAPVRRTYSKTAAYGSDPATFHRVSAVAGTVTAVWQGPHVRETSHVIAHDPPTPYAPARSTPERTSSTLQEIARLLREG
jgi:hypothetical protein